jgi:hypothetical protein
MTISLKALHEKREQLKAGLAQISDLRRGSLIARFRKCGKPNCHCAQKDSPGHGPSYSLIHASGGKTITQAPPGPRAQDQIGTRLKRSGMHWTVRGANAIIALRCSKLSGRFQDFWERRSERIAACPTTFLRCTQEE